MRFIINLCYYTSMSKPEQPPTPEIPKETKILVIDDAPYTLDAIQSIFNWVDIKITTATNGQEALDILQQQPDFDLIITDLVMPTMDGYSFLKAIINNPEITTCRTFIIQTSNPIKEHIDIFNSYNEQLQEKDPTAQIRYLSKSYSGEELISFVASSLA
jgi:CheY-like chemotaxis protein